jgi:hypothetical protein
VNFNSRRDIPVSEPVKLNPLHSRHPDQFGLFTLPEIVHLQGLPEALAAFPQV